MGLIDSILNLAGVLLWLGWRSNRLDPLVKATPATLIGTLRRAEPQRLKGWQLLVALMALLVLRGLLYQQIGPEAEWTPKLNLFVVVLPFRGNLFLPALLFSVLSFLRLLIICYFWLLALAVINGRSAPSDPMLKLVRQHLGPVARWPRLLQACLPLLAVAGLWMALHPLLVQLGSAGRVRSLAQLAGQGFLVGGTLYLSLQYVLPVFLLLYLIADYVYLGANPLWEFVRITARNILAPLDRLPLRVARFDFAPLVGVVLILLLLHWVPSLIVGRMAQANVNLWPQ